MVKLSENQNGFSVIEVTLILVIVALISTVGILVYRHENKAKPTLATNQSSDSLSTSGWKPYRSQAGDFSILFPPSSAPQTIPPTNLTYNGMNCKANEAYYHPPTGTVYEVAEIICPASSLLPSAASLLQHWGSFYQNVRLISLHSTTVRGKTAETYGLTGTLNDSAFYISGEALVSGNISYDINVQHPGNSKAPNTQQFLNSFKLVN
ncbi:MAG TPA: hypothetical protein VHB72_03720 [Candidatus Saccharimonadales bacterium]|nr:hypothetical protein [Candidatus Saccharimonadales bacterium]